VVIYPPFPLTRWLLLQGGNSPVRIPRPRQCRDGGGQAKRSRPD